jgi:hypothetical protein
MTPQPPSEAFVEYRPADEGGNLCHWARVDQHITGSDCPCNPARTKFPAGIGCGKDGHTQDDVKITPSGRAYCRKCRRAHEKRRKTRKP